jgi:voltage-gated potassium channel
MNCMKKRVYDVLAVASRGDKLSRAFDVFLVALITSNIVAMVLETIEPCYKLAPRFFAWFETVSVLVFTVEYVLRVWSSNVSDSYRSPVTGRLRFMLTPLAVIDLLAILPFYLPFLGLDLRSFRALRLFRIIRIFKLGRYSTAMQLTARVVASRGPELITTLSILLVLMLLSASLMYYAERDAQPEAFSSIPAAMWWAIATLSTVGYGDVYPLTAVGKLLASVIALLGIGMFALPTGILGAAFVQELEQTKGIPRKCPHCGLELNKASTIR